MKTIDASTIDKPATSDKSRCRVHIVVTGQIKQASRVISEFQPGEVTTIAAFRMNYIWNAQLDPETSEGKQAISDEAHRFIKQSLTNQDAVFTDLDGVVRSFDPPARNPWWIAVGDISYGVTCEGNEAPATTETTQAEAAEAA